MLLKVNQEALEARIEKEVELTIIHFTNINKWSRTNIWSFNSWDNYVFCLFSK